MRPWLGVAPLGLALALAAHALRFGDSHPFGGAASHAVQALLAAGTLCALGLGAGSLLGRIIPGRRFDAPSDPLSAEAGARMAALIALCGSLFYGIGELLEGNAPGHGDAPATLFIILLFIVATSVLTSLGIRLAVRALCSVVVAVCALFERLRESAPVFCAPMPVPVAAGITASYTRFSRPPPARS